MNKKNDLKILKFPNNIAQSEKQVDAILFAAEEPLDIKSIQEIELLNEQINLLKPKIIILAGSTAVQSFLGIDEPISKIRGQWIEKDNIKYMPIFHPSYLLRNPSKNKGKPKWLTWQDLKKVKKELNSI